MYTVYSDLTHISMTSSHLSSSSPHWHMALFQMVHFHPHVIYVCTFNLGYVYGENILFVF